MFTLIILTIAVLVIAGICECLIDGAAGVIIGLYFLLIIFAVVGKFLGME